MRLVLDARTAAFAALIDYAGVFPPASLPLDEAVRAYRDLRLDDHGWVAGRFLCRASQLTGLAAIATTTFREGEAPWEVGVVFDRPMGESTALSVDFQAEMDPVITIGSAEAKPSSSDTSTVNGLLDSMFTIAPDVVPFIEIDRHESISGQIEMLSRALSDRSRVGGAKLRCGGTEVDAFPAPDEVAEFIASATDNNVPFKATAGLHQPIRHFDPAIGVHRHGFVNLLMATLLAEQGADRTTIEEIVAETDLEAFRMSAAFATWRDEKIPGTTVRQMRKRGFVAYGSCDFEEPIEALEALSFLGGGS